jgi:hypothetical protein
MKPIEHNRDYYLENDRVIFTAAFHVKRGSCCGNGCRHCPYTKPHKRGNTQLQEHVTRNTNSPENGGSET